VCLYVCVRLCVCVCVCVCACACVRVEGFLILLLAGRVDVHVSGTVNCSVKVPSIVIYFDALLFSFLSH
jgi:hypothetical protein